MDAEMQMTWLDFERMAKEFIRERRMQPEEARIKHEPRQLGELLVRAYCAGMRAQRHQTIRYLELSDDLAVRHDATHPIGTLTGDE